MSGVANVSTFYAVIKDQKLNNLKQYTFITSQFPLVESPDTAQQESLLQGLVGCNPDVIQDCTFIKKLNWGNIHFQDSSGCWQNLFPCCCVNESPNILLSVSQKPLQVLETTHSSLPCNSLQRQFITLLFASSRPA